MTIKFIITFKRPIRQGHDIIQSIGLFDSIHDAGVYYRQLLEETHPDMKASVLDASIESIHVRL